MSLDNPMSRPPFEPPLPAVIEYEAFATITFSGTVSARSDEAAAEYIRGYIIGQLRGTQLAGATEVESVQVREVN